MLEDDLLRLADRVAPPVRPDLPEAVLARLDGPHRAPSAPWRRRAVVATVTAAVVAAGGWSPQVRAVAADLLGLAGIEISRDEPDAPPTPARPLPDTREAELADAVEAAAFPLWVPARLGDPATVRVAQHGRVVSMEWRGGTVVLDQFEGTLGAVFAKQVGGLALAEVDLDGVPGWWIPGPHDLVYVDRHGQEVTATARLAGPTLVWEGAHGVTFRLEGSHLTRHEAVAIARSLAGTR